MDSTAALDGFYCSIGWILLQHWMDRTHAGFKPTSFAILTNTSLRARATIRQRAPHHRLVAKGGWLIEREEPPSANEHRTTPAAPGDGTCLNVALDDVGQSVRPTVSPPTEFTVDEWGKIPPTACAMTESTVAAVGGLLLLTESMVAALGGLLLLPAASMEKGKGGRLFNQLSMAVLQNLGAFMCIQWSEGALSSR
jgi:hypothetical protein